MDTIDGDKLRGHLVPTVDPGHLWRRARSAFGLEILHRLEERGCGLLKLKEGSLYPALYRLEAAGEVVAVWEKEQKGRRGARRRIYRLSLKGQKKLQLGRGERQTFVSTSGTDSRGGIV